MACHTVRVDSQHDGYLSATLTVCEQHTVWTLCRSLNSGTWVRWGEGLWGCEWPSGTCLVDILRPSVIVGWLITPKQKDNHGYCRFWRHGIMDMHGEITAIIIERMSMASFRRPVHYTTWNISSLSCIQGNGGGWRGMDGGTTCATLDLASRSRLSAWRGCWGHASGQASLLM